MSSRHQSRRRRAYGRREHEVRERRQRGSVDRDTHDDHDEAAPSEDADVLGSFGVAIRAMPRIPITIVRPDVLTAGLTRDDHVRAADRDESHGLHGGGAA